MTTLISHRPICDTDQVAEVTTYQGSISLRIHALGFLELARSAIKNVQAIDAVTPSIVYAIRHAVELFLKYIICELREENRMSRSQPMGHSLAIIFNDWKVDIAFAMEIDAQYGGFDSRAWFKEFESIISELQNVDPDGQSLRYPRNKQDLPNLNGKMLISLGQLDIFASSTQKCFEAYIERNA